jgi:O-acetyl-ADP-ribose deacetylase (regulator of RNase III)
MPVGSLEEDLLTEPTVRALVEQQQRLDVSYEALALRVVRLTDFPVAAFAASRVNPKDQRPLRLDYAFASRAWTVPLPRRGPVKAEGLSDCTAVGYTSGADDVRWPGLQAPVRMECVGAPPFPGHRWPRVLGFLVADRPAKAEYVRTVLGDATTPLGDPPWIVAHVVNDRARTWHAGFAAALRRRHPESQRAFTQYALNERLRLGDVVTSKLADELTVASMIAQAGYGPATSPRIRYQALRDCLAKVASIAAQSNASVHMPRIGTGQAGGRWSIVRALVDEELAARGVPVVIYELPGTRTAVTQEELPL